MTEPTITCPNCRTQIPLTELLAAPIIQATEGRYKALLDEKTREIAARETGLKEREATLAKEKAAIDTQVAEKLGAERKRIAAEEAANAKRLLAADFEQKAKELAELQIVLKQRDEKLAEAQKAQAEMMRKERALDDARREMDLTIETKVQESLAAVREKAKLEAEDALKLRIAEREEQIAGMQRQIEDLKRKAEQGSQQLQGEVQEIELEATLKARFPHDVIEPVAKGEFGGDILQRVVGPGGQPCGTILWESKRTKNWSPGWLTKLRDDQHKAGADVALILSNALPNGVHNFDHVEGIWVTETRCAMPVALALRLSLIEIASARQASEGQQTKAEMMYRYLTGPRFRHRIEAIVERFSEMKDDLDRERKAMTRLWAKREAQIQGVIEFDRRHVRRAAGHRRQGAGGDRRVRSADDRSNGAGRTRGHSLTPEELGTARHDAASATCQHVVMHGRTSSPQHSAWICRLPLSCAAGCECLALAAEKRPHDLLTPEDVRASVAALIL